MYDALCYRDMEAAICVGESFVNVFDGGDDEVDRALWYSSRNEEGQEKVYIDRRDQEVSAVI